MVQWDSSLIEKIYADKVREKSDGKWTLPGGWADIGKSLSETVSAEVCEEASIRASAARVIAVLDRGKQSHPVSPFSSYKIFVEAALEVEGAFRDNTETAERGFFILDALPELSEERINSEQVAMCFEAHRVEHFACRFD